ncbi:mechanosensitive ion channel [Devosia sp. XJ19-1]|uniref:Mechanosensitive ion channel n=1 Tax=Devosia ureilytica TaxID=2952754 RepID=A0A9Q4ARP7_9HYPH|nr:mechanosensitive ion channel domain-containing protein [Devosia ureilytica]MCP8884821.1 mechanosensitive ion channel [Devosia ureilytica]MCP8888452.1 mechanosensitive ion channel [Devosia ureilytica]
MLAISYSVMQSSPMVLIRFIFLSLLLTFPASAQDILTGQVTSVAEPDTSSAAVDDLIRILEDDAARAVLIERLQQAAPDPVANEAEAAAPDLSIARQLAEYTRGVAEGASATVRSVGTAIGNLQQVFSGSMSADSGALREFAINIGLLVVALFGGFFVLRLIANGLGRGIAARAAGGGLIRRLMGLVGLILVDAGSVVLAWGLGYGLALNFGTTPNGQMGINQSLLLNAFLIVEAVKLLVRLVLVPRFPALRLLPVTDGNAAYWSFWLGRIISLLGYTFLFVSPMLNSLVSRAAGSAIQVLAMATAVTIGIIIVLQNKDDVRAWLQEISVRRDNDGLGRALAAVGRQWHVLVIVYLVALLVVWFANPETALPFMIGATVQSAFAILIGSLVIGFITRFVSAGLSLPDDVRQRLPLLETRLKSFVPAVMRVVRWIIIAAVVLAIGQAWALFNFAAWIGSDEGLAVAGSVVSAALIILAAIVLHVVVASWVEYRLNVNFGRVPTSREKTLLNLFKNAFTIALVVFGTMLALAQIGVNIAPLLAGAGVVGLAIGFGAQKLVQDIITGIFIQFENIMNEGDVVAVGSWSGVVEKLTIRSVTIRDLSGTVHLIPFSSVDQVSNMMRGFSYHVAEIGVAYDSDIDAVKAAMHEAFELLMQTEHKDEILDELDMQGITAFGDSAITVRARIKTLPGKQWGAGRKYSELVKTVFAQHGIEIPYPHVTYVPAGGSAKGRLPAEPADNGPDGDVD